MLLLFLFKKLLCHWWAFSKPSVFSPFSEGHSSVSHFCQWKAVPLNNPSRLSCWNRAEFAPISLKLLTGLPLSLTRTQSVPRKKKLWGLVTLAIPLSQALLMVGLWAAPQLSLEAHLCTDQKLHLSTGRHQVSSADSQNVGLGHKSSHRAATAEKPQRKKHQRGPTASYSEHSHFGVYQEAES